MSSRKRDDMTITRFGIENSYCCGWLVRKRSRLGIFLGARRVPWIEIDSRQVHFTARPGGPQSIVFLHGGFGSSSDLWADAMAALPPAWSAYAIDNFLH